MRTVKALVRLRGCPGSPEPLLVAYVISTCTIISRAGLFVVVVVVVVLWLTVPINSYDYAMIMLRLSFNLTTPFLGKLRSKLFNQYLVYIPCQ